VVVERDASRTAVVVGQGRAVAHERLAVGRFSDPTAMGMLRDDERVVVERVRAAAPPAGWRDRMDFELVRACGEVMAPRTVAIDDAVRDRPNAQVVILGAGLDGRAWRMAELADVVVYEVDRPASQQDKRDRVGDLRPVAKSVHFVPVNFGKDDLASTLAAAGHDAHSPTTWIWEGVVPYLTRRQVATTVRMIGDLSAPGSRLVVNYQAPAFTAAAGRLAMRAFATIARRVSPLSGEPNRSSWTPRAMAQMLDRAGFSVIRGRDLFTIAGELSMDVHQSRSLRSGCVAVAERL
jgi:methyltransferase (TIGR00027 family)